MTPAQVRATITLMGWMQAGRAFYKVLPDGYLHASVCYDHVVRVYVDALDQGWAEPMSMDDARLRELYRKIIRYEREGLTQL